MLTLLNINLKKYLHDEKQLQMIWFCLNQFLGQQDTFEVAPIHLLDPHRLIDSVDQFQL